MGQSAVLRYLAEVQATNNRLQAEVDAHRRLIATLGDGLVMLARVNGIEGHLARLVRQADLANPSQPVPAPASEAPTDTSQDALDGDSATPVTRGVPEGGNSAQTLFTPGTVPGSTTDVPADAVTTVMGAVYAHNRRVAEETLAPTPAEHQDVTAPVAGTEGPQPTDDVRLEVDVVAPGPVTWDVANPLAGGPFANAEKVGSTARFVASMRLARLRVASGTAVASDDVIEAQAIMASDMPDLAIQHEIATLEQVRQATATRQPPAARHLVPRTAGADPAIRQAPAFAEETTDGQPVHHLGSFPGGAVTSDEVAFE